MINIIVSCVTSQAHHNNSTVTIIVKKKNIIIFFPNIIPALRPAGPAQPFFAALIIYDGL